MITKNYKLFRLHPAARGTKAKHVRDLKVSLARHGWIEGVYLTVRRKGARLEIINGKDLFQAAKELGLPIRYEITTKEVHPCEMAEQVLGRFRAADFVAAYAGTDPHVRQLRDFAERHGVPVVSAAAMLTGETTAVAGRAIRQRQFKVVDPEVGEEVARIVDSLREQGAKWAVHRLCLSALALMVRCPSVDPQRFMQRLAHCPTRLRQCVSIDAYLELFEGIYNYDLSVAKHLGLRLSIRHMLAAQAKEERKLVAAS